MSDLVKEVEGSVLSDKEKAVLAKMTKEGIPLSSLSPSEVGCLGRFMKGNSRHGSTVVEVYKDQETKMKCVRIKPDLSPSLILEAMKNGVLE